MSLRFLPIVSLILGSLLLAGCDLLADQTDQYILRGNTMGTSYTIKALRARGKIDKEALYNDIKATLDNANDKLNNWTDDTEISRFNASPSTNWQDISPTFLEVLQEAQRIHAESNGRFDITLSPLIDMWGFGPEDNETLPSKAEIDAALANVGQDSLLELRNDPPSLRKRRGAVSVNLGAIAKGYSADLIARTLEKHGITDYLVEIGGDLIARGVNDMGVPWRVGIEKPNEIGRAVQLVVSVTDMGLATSGDYRNFFLDEEGRRMSHIIDPVTGRPVTHNLASVTVLAADGMRADGLATALLVLGEEEGREMANRLNIPAYFITREEEGFATSSSKAFDALMAKQNKAASKGD
ncbi:FAD:protein FMN transferase [Cohaesibacter sp. CAU 1516]|uniref:FAD:protein FMN transferase n=1 Tax=Cohaesibacter sp. CAU 1516 TaxID=2576038 RepID=UPI0010FCE5A9|nr:FAD:protein FMN transferase [Cohaesibacter sp. CAU 1516]TLP45009.1 FAD:protein FMN transferase [Cohaesibacter sp. CAU 1516]